MGKGTTKPYNPGRGWQTRFNGEKKLENRTGFNTEQSTHIFTAGLAFKAQMYLFRNNQSQIRNNNTF